METFPLFLKLSGRYGLVVGANVAAIAKIDLLLRAGAKVVVAVDDISPALAHRREQVEIRPLSEAEAWVGRAAIIFIARMEETLTRRLVEAARRERTPVNVVDRPDLSDFLMGALVDRSPLLVSICSNGAAPILVRNLRRRIEAMLPERIGALASLARRLRDLVKSGVRDMDGRRRFWESFFDGPPAEAALAGKEEEAWRGALSLLRRERTEPRAKGVVHLVGAGSGDPDLLTLRAHRLMGEADAIVYDRLISPEILARARRDAELIPVGKAKGLHSVSQFEINELLVRLALAGKKIVRLKGGDPFVFGRGGEELEHLRAFGIEVFVTPGVTSAFASAALAQIPVTHRKLARSVSLVSGHAASGEPEPDWSAFNPNETTLALYMGVSVIGKTAQKLMASGWSADTPTAIIERAGWKSERRIFCRLDALEETIRAQDVKGPAIMLIGRTVSLAQEWPERVADFREIAFLA